MSYGESISLKLVNNTDQPQRIGLLGGTASTYSNSNNNVVVQWDLSGETYTGSTVVLGTTVSAEQPLLTASIIGVVNALNLMNKGVFTYSGNIVYATTLTDNSVETANLTLQAGTFISQLVTIKLINFLPQDFFIANYTLAYIKSLYASNTPVTNTLYIPPSDTWSVNTQIYTDSLGSTQQIGNSNYITEPNVTANTSITTNSNGKITAVVPFASIGAVEPNLATQSTQVGLTGDITFDNFTGIEIQSPFMSNNGLYLFLFNRITGRIYRYPILIPFNLLSVSGTSDQSGQLIGGTTQGVTFAPNGDSVIHFEDDTFSVFNQWNMSTAWDLTTLTQVTVNSGIQNSSSTGWSPTGEYLLSGQINNNLFSYELDPFSLVDPKTSQTSISDSAFLTTTPSGQKIQTIVSDLGGKFYYVYKGGTIIECNIPSYTNLTSVSENANFTVPANNNYSLIGIVFNLTNNGYWTIQGNSNNTGQSQLRYFN
mgnify:FL=1|tara:strand:+ start:38 stop:1486 length:1449 start_codon:yes stop_codon:yes gene_type:complete